MTRRPPTDIDARTGVFSGGPTARRTRPIVRLMLVNGCGRPAVQETSRPVRTGARSAFPPAPCLRRVRGGPQPSQATYPTGCSIEPPACQWSATRTSRRSQSAGNREDAPNERLESQSRRVFRSAARSRSVARAERRKRNPGPMSIQADPPLAVHRPKLEAVRRGAKSFQTRSKYGVRNGDVAQLSSVSRRRAPSPCAPGGGTQRRGRRRLSPRRSHLPSGRS